ncbi:MAG: glycoside hydrolase family 32 protein [archaeon]
MNQPSRRSLLVASAGLLLAGGIGLATFSEQDEDNRDRSMTDPHRPLYHFAPQEGWMNDPNGLVYQDGTYHLFYQAGEDERRWDHATSANLVTWQEHGTKLPVEDGVQQFSGGAAIDEHDDAGFGPDAMILAYTGHHEAAEKEDQRLAYSTDRGETVTKYAGNPIIPSDHDDFRDPNIFQYGEGWRMVVSRVAPTQNRPTGIEIYSSDDLRSWTYENTYELTHSSGATAWECPDLYELPVEGTEKTRWVMTNSADWDREVHYVGDFDGDEFVEDEQFLADEGHDFYAGMTWANEPENRRLLVGWMSHWEYAHDIPDLGWKGMLSFPRRVTLEQSDGEVEIRQRPARELEKVRGKRLADITSETIKPDEDPLAGTNAAGRALVIEARIRTDDAEEIGFRVRESASEQTKIAYHAGLEGLLFDRGSAGAFFDADTFGRSYASLSPLADDTIELQILLDTTSVEIFANDGQMAMSNLIFPDPESTGVSAYVKGGTAEIQRLVVDAVEPNAKTNTDSIL